MKRYKIIFLIGLWVIVIPFLGVPLLAKKILLVIPGALLILIGILMSQEREQQIDDESGIAYAETMPSAAEETDFEISSEEAEKAEEDGEHTILTNPKAFQASTAEVEDSNGDE
jgi:hypothetical protein